jgi:hypothetical protein
VQGSCPAEPLLPVLIVSFSSFVLRCLGTDIVASNDLAPARNIALSLKMLAEALKQLVDQPGLRQRLAKQPDRGGLRHRVLELQIEKAA